MSIRASEYSCSVEQCVSVHTLFFTLRSHILKLNPEIFMFLHKSVNTCIKITLFQMFLHGTDMASLHKHIPPENLPEEWGGTRPPFTSRLTKTLMHLNEHKFDGNKNVFILEFSLTSLTNPLCTGRLFKLHLTITLLFNI